MQGRRKSERASPDRCSAALRTRQLVVAPASWWLTRARWLVRARDTTTNNSTTARGSTRSALLALLCGFSSSSAFGSDISFGSVLCSTSLASMPSSPVASGDASGFSAEQLDGYTADELKRLVKERGLPWPDRNDPARAARGRSVGSGLVKKEERTSFA